MSPKTCYAKSTGDVDIAYQVVGNGPMDLLYIPGQVNHIESTWDEPALARHCQRLASFSRLILFDKRGTGLSDRVSARQAPTLEERMDDARAVLDAAGVERAAVYATADGVPVAILFAATYPDRVSALVLYAATARSLVDDDYPIGASPEDLVGLAELFENWGDELDPTGVDILAPSLAADPRWRRSLGRMERLAGTPQSQYEYFRMSVFETDVRDILPTVAVPTLVIRVSDDLLYSAEEGRYVAEHIPDAAFVEVAGTDHLYWSQNGDVIADEIEEFLTGAREARTRERVLATVLFTDIVRSTELATDLGDRRWRDLLDDHDRVVRHQLDRFRGREVKTTGDGFLATFDGPARAIRCALTIENAARELGIAVRAGIHTGEVELRGDDVGGIAVHIGQRVSSFAAAGEVLVSRTVADLVAGSGIAFADRGEHQLKGVTGTWRLLAVVS